MLRIFIVLFFCLSLTFAASARIKVITTLFPEYDFVRSVGGDKVDVKLLLPPGIEPHAFEPTPQDILDINRADIFIYTNRYMEPWVETLLKGTTGKNLLVVDASRGIQFMRGSGGVDPHVWLDLGNAQIMVDNVRDALIAKDPGDGPLYSSNADNYKQRLRQMDRQFKAALADCKHKLYIFGGHFAFSYFNRRYGLEYLSPYRGFSPDAEPTAKALIELIGKMRANDIKYVYYEELISPKVAQTIARETGAKLLLLHGAHNLSRSELGSGITFLSIMERDLNNLKVGLECRQK
ncbi:MAG: zinc ABC transporter substrate-binding protein [Candidatus Margulisbacteria bacterium]|nr:zinc ABC transporter substrate-binding protein [Candidatus Margulisiibacteriota bacterium]